MITREQYNGINFNNLKKHMGEIEEYEGEIPFYLYTFININNRFEYLDKVNNQYEYSNMAEYRRNIDIDKDIDNFIKWINNNPQFEDTIKIKK